MKPKEAVALLEKSVSLPGAGVTRTALVINPKATDKELGELGAALVAIDGSRSWWMGDYALFLYDRKRAELLADLTEKRKAEGKPLTDEDREDITTAGTGYLAEKARVLGIDEGSFRNCQSVARFYRKLSYRNDNPAIGFAHHVAAIVGAGGATGEPKRAVAWLIRAEENGWSVSQLREQINRSQSTAKQPELEPLANPWQPLDDADEWARQIEITGFTPDAARTQLSRIAALLAFIAKLQELAK